MSQIVLKQGASFQISMTFAQDGAPLDLTGWSFVAQIRDSQSALLATLSCTQPAGVPGALNVAFNGSTASWAPGRYFCDVVCVRADGVIQPTETFGVVVNPAITISGSTS